MKVLIILTCKPKEKKVNLMFEIGVKFKKSRLAEKSFKGVGKLLLQTESKQITSFCRNL